MKVSRNFISKIIVAIAGLALICGVPAIGQVIKGSMSGTVTDPQGAVISGAQVKATKTDTGEVSTTTSDSSGLFRLSLIPAGLYKIEISAQGFKTQVQSGIQVTAGSDKGLGLLKLAVGESSTTVEVTSAAPLVETSQAQVTNTFSGTTLQTFSGIQENQGLDNLALFVPGVASSRDNNFSNTNGGLGFSSNGLRGRNNDQEIDGQDNNDNSVTGPALIFTDPNFVQQYVLITNNFGPEYGRNAGSVVNIITASGTNNWHGSVYGNENNSVLNGLPMDEKVAGLTAPPRANDVFAGATVGGPFVKNKLFFFGGFDTEIVSTSTSDISGTITPTPAGISLLSSCFPGSVAVANLAKFGPYGISGGNPTPGAISASSASIPGCGTIPEATVSRLLSTPTDIYNFITRLDWQASNRDTVSGRYVYSNTDAINTNAFGSAAAGYPANVPALSQIVLLSWTHNFSPRMVNEFRVGFDRLSVQFGGNNIGNTIPTIANISSAITDLNFTDATTLSFGVPSGAPQGRYNNTWQGQDNWSYVMGKHQLKMGVNYTHQQTPSTFLPGVNGQFNFSSLANYIANTPSATLFTVGDPEIGFKEDNTFLYV
ncbi:MAG TPA: TonB-dependent receptor, partial [Terriglobia bacterium]|nr:TonB-dependent receptor [Terriglobia bacterium]